MPFMWRGPTCDNMPNQQCTISWLSEQPWKPDSQNIFGGSLKHWSFDLGMSSGAEMQLFYLNLKELEKNSVKFAFFYDNILIFAYFGESKLKKGVKSGCGVSSYLSMWFTIQLI